jgi:hypothetical protein
LIQLSIHLLNIENAKPIHYTAVCIIKNLVAGSNGILFPTVIDANVYRLLTNRELIHNQWSYIHDPSTPISLLVSFVGKATGDNDSGIRNEGGRVLVHVIKCLHRNKAIQFLDILTKQDTLSLIIQRFLCQLEPQLIHLYYYISAHLLIIVHQRK